MTHDEYLAQIRFRQRQIGVTPFENFAPCLIHCDPSDGGCLDISCRDAAGLLFGGRHDPSVFEDVQREPRKATWHGFDDDGAELPDMVKWECPYGDCRFERDDREAVAQHMAESGHASPVPTDYEISRERREMARSAAMFVFEVLRGRPVFVGDGVPDAGVAGDVFESMARFEQRRREQAAA